MEIHHFPQVQILGNHAKIREGRQYIDLGFYNGDGTFEWSPEGARRRDEIVGVKDAEDSARWESQGPIEDQIIKDSIAEELAEAKLRNAARHQKQNRRGR